MFQHITTTRIKTLTAALAVVLTAGVASAEVTITALEVGNDVVFSGSGSMDLSSASSLGDFTGGSAWIDPARPAFRMGGSANISLYGLPALTGPSNFGTGAFLNATSNSGDTCALDAVESIAQVPMGYSSGSPMTSSATFANHSFASLGLTQGTYTWTWNTATGTDSLTLQIGPPPVVVTNVTQSTTHSTLQDALNNANSGDAIEIAAGTLFEDNIFFPSGLNVTITGAGMNQTTIDGGGATEPVAPILQMNSTGQTAATVISNLTLANGHGSDFGGAAQLWGVSPTFRNVAFRDSEGGTISDPTHVSAAGSNARFEYCEFTGAGFGSGVESGVSTIELFQCLLHNNGFVTVAGNVSLVSCTIESGATLTLIPVGETMTVTNCVIASPQSTWDAAITMSHTLATGAPAGNGNINGSPTFVDAAGGDYRLAPGSLGIDAADFDAYAAAGGGLFDLSGADRTVDDLATVDTGAGAFAFLDMGAYESPAQAASCPGDVTGDNMVDIADLNILLFNFGNTCP